MKHVEQLIIRHFSDDDLSADERRGMREHLRKCDACREEYDQAAELLRAVAGAEPTRREMDSWRRGVVEAVDEPAAEAPEAEPGEAGGWLPGWLLTRLAPGLAMAALVVVAVLVARRQGTEDVPDVLYRGTPDAGTGTSRPAPPVLVDLAMYAISATEGTAPVPRKLSDGDSVALDEYLQVFRVCSSMRIKHLYVLGLDSRLQPLDYYPRPSVQQSVSIPECSTTPRAVGRSIRLAKRHVKGPLWVVALYSEEPLTRAEVHEKISSARAAGLTAAAVKNIKYGSGVYPVVKRFVVTDRRP